MSTTERIKTDPRISRRRRAIERSRRKRVLTGVASAAGVAAVVWLAFVSPVLDVRQVVVVGGRHISSQDAAAAAMLGRDDNLLLLSTGEIARRIEQLPWVRSAKVERKLPGTVRVRVVERRAAAVLSLGSARWTLDRFGNVLTEGGVADLPVLAGVGVSDVTAGTKLTDVVVQDALTAWRSLPPRIRRRVEAVVAPTAERITLSLDDGTQIRFGAAESLRSKNEVLEVLLAQVRAEGVPVAYIDVRVPTSPAVSTAPDDGASDDGVADAAASDDPAATSPQASPTP